MELTFASYNIRKSIGLDRRRDPERILAILNEIGADVVALQEADRRFGQRPTTLPRQLLEEHHWQIAPVALRPLSIGWHGNALLVRRGIDILDAQPLALPTLEPRGALRAFDGDWRVLAPGRSFPARQPVAQLDRIVVSADWRCEGHGVHHSALAARGSDHLPVWARLGL